MKTQTTATIAREGLYQTRGLDCGHVVCRKASGRLNGVGEGLHCPACEAAGERSWRTVVAASDSAV